MIVRITEHTTSDEPFLEIEEIYGEGRTGEFYGSIDDFRNENPTVRIAEEIWS